MTLPAGEKVYVPYARVIAHVDAPSYQFIPSGAETDACGERLTIGINDLGCEVLSPTDIRGVSR